MNHHQLGLCDEISNIVGKNNFSFIANEPLPVEKKDLGYQDDNKIRDYIIRPYGDQKAMAEKALNSADFIINTFGQGIKEIKTQLRDGKRILWYNERLFKDYNFVKTSAKYIRAKYYFSYGKDSNLYFLNASYYGYKDICALKNKSWANRCYQFGYFPLLPEKKYRKSIQTEELRLLFVGRLLDWKHPDLVLECAKYLKAKNVRFHIQIIGIGPLFDYIKKKIAALGFMDSIELLGAISSEKINYYYQTNDAFLFLSDRREGWGAVLNEAMANGCIPIANIEAGASLCLISEGKNGFLYKNKEELFEKTIQIEQIKKSNNFFAISNNSINTIFNEWNYHIMANRLVEMLENILFGEVTPDLYDSGPLEKSK